MSKMVGLTNQLSSIVNEIKDEDARLNSELSKVDRELTDMYHYIEFSNLNASEGYKAYKDIKDILIRRRAIKDDMKVYSYFTSKIKSFDDIPHFCDEIQNKVDSQEYAPRVRTDLFYTEVKNNNFVNAVTPNPYGILDNYMIMKVVCFGKNNTHLEFNGFEDALKYILKKEHLSDAHMDTKKNVAKKLLNACLADKKYSEFRWSFPTLIKK